MAYQTEKTEQGLEYEIYTSPIIKSQNDKREYSYIKLPNHLQVLIISDEKAEKSAAALDVFVGSQNDPVDFPGLAHFCEHLLFMGNKKYPKENDYSEYLAKNAGYYNAFTSYDHTNYYFEVGTDHLEGALDRFAQFFISSLFSPSCTEREIKAVDSENKKNLQNDNWRVYQLQKSHSKPDHPFSFFSTGNLDTLLETPKSKGLDTREELLKFYRKYYSSNIMRLVVAGKESIKQLIEWTVPRFSPIPNLGIDPPTYPGSPFGEEHVKTKTSIVPVKDSRSLDLQFEIPSQLGLYESKPAIILAHFIGHEGPGSILSLLKLKGLATDLYAATVVSHVAFCTFAISIELTNSGADHIEEVTEIVFQYIELLKKKGVSKELFEELKNINEASFRFQEKSKVSNYASRLSGRMHRPFPPHKVLSSSLLFDKYDPELIQETLNCLNPDSLRMTFIGKEVQERKDLIKERWYGTEHITESINSDFLKKLKSIELNTSLSLPKINPFIPTNFDLITTKESMQKIPVLLNEDRQGSLWYCQGDYQVPKATASIFIKNPSCYASPRTFVKLELLKSILLENLNEFGYDAQMAGLSYDLDVQYNGINIIISGYSHKLEVLLAEIIEHIKNYKSNAMVFDTCKEKMVRELKNFSMKQPMHHSGYFTFYGLCEKAWTDEDKAFEAPYITEEELTIFAKEFFSRGFITAMIVGNIGEKDAIKLYEHVQSQFSLSPLQPSELISRRNVLLPGPSCSFFHQKAVFNPDTLDSSVEFYLDIFSYRDIEIRAYTELISYLISEPAFNQLRTVEQLGYMVFGGSRLLASRGGIRIIVQSEKDPVYLESRIESFLVQFLEQMEEMSPEEFKNKVDGAISIKLKKDENLSSLARRHWQAINSGFCDFDEAEEIVKVLREVTQPKVVELLKEYTLRDSPRRRKFSLQMRSQKLGKDVEKDGDFELKDCGQEIPDLVDWILTQELSPAPFPIIKPKVFDENTN